MYNKDNIMGAILVHKNGIDRYKVVEVNSVNQTDYSVVTERLHDNNIVDRGWITLEKINRYRTEGVYSEIIPNTQNNYQIY